MSNALTVTRGAKVPMSANARQVNFDLVEQLLGQYVNTGMPGQIISFKKGFWKVGYGKKTDPKLKDNEFVLNFPNVMFAWRKWSDGRPTTPHMAYPMLGEKLPDRDELGDTDESLWDVSDYTNEPMDPWRQVVIIMMRRPDGEDLYRIELESISAKMSFLSAMQEYVEKGRKRPDELPIIALEVDERDVKDSNKTYFIPVFEFTGDWVDVEDYDAPDGGVVAAAPVDDDDDGDDEEEAPKPKKSTRTKAKAKPKPVEDDEEEEEEEKPTPRKSRAKKKAEPVEDEDDEDDTPAASVKRRRV